jgi:phage-related protein
MALSVVFFRTLSGSEPVREWLRSLDRGDREVIGADLRTVQLGFPIGMPVCRPLGGGLYEVRSSLRSRREARVLFFVSGGDLVVVEGFIKKTRTTPQAAMEVAIRRKADYERSS